MGRKKGKRNPSQLQVDRGNSWYTHYFQYLTSLAYQLFEWKNLPDSIDPRYLEMSLHQLGYVGFYRDKEKGFIASQGALSGTVNHYNLPTYFHANSPTYQKNFPIYHYTDMDPTNRDYGAVIFNNDYHFPTMSSLKMFAEDLAELKEVIYVNQNAQKTPYVIATNDLNRHTVMNIYNQVEANAPAVFHHESFDMENFQILPTQAPYVVDKLNVQKNAVWNEVMTFLGIKNANIEKRERMVTAEAESNNEQIDASANIFLKARLEACERINKLYDLDLTVEIRHDAVEELLANLTPNPGGVSQ